MKSTLDKGLRSSFIFYVAISFIGFSHFADAKARRFTGFPDGLVGAGLLLGEPTGLRGAYFTDWKRAWSVSTGYSFSKVMTLSVDYLFYGYKAYDKLLNQDFWNSLIFYGGGGVAFGFGLSNSDPNDKFITGVRAIGGSEYVFVDSPWSARIEIAPQLNFKGHQSVSFGIIVGLTYYFFDSVRDRSPRPVSSPQIPQGKSKPKTTAQPDSEFDSSQDQADDKEFD